MSFKIQPLFEPTQLTNAIATYYTAAVRTRIDKLTLYNTSSTLSITATVYWVPSGGAAGTSNINTIHTLLPNETYDIFGLIGQTLGIGDLLAAVGSTTAVLNFQGSGLLMTA